MHNHSVKRDLYGGFRVYRDPYELKQQTAADQRRCHEGFDKISIIGVFESYGTAEGILIRGKNGSEAERYAKQNGCAFEEAKEL